MPFPFAKDDKVFICVLLDGLGFDLVKKIGFLDGTLDSIRPLKTVFGYSCAAQPSILTGKMPNEHGGFCVYYHSRNSIFSWLRLLPLLPESTAQNLAKNAANITRRVHNVTGYFNTWKIPVSILPQFQLYERKGFYLDNPIDGIPTIIDEAKERGLSVAAYYWNTPDGQIFSETYENMRNRRADFHFLYIARTDQLLHLNGNDPSRIEGELKLYEERIRRILQIAGENYNEVALLVFSDHGMLDITGTIDVMGTISKLPYRLGRDYLAFYDATMVRFWFNNSECRDRIIDAMSGINGIRLMPDDELESLGCLFPDRRYGEIIYVVDGGKIICPGFFGKIDYMRGMHGYLPCEPGYSAFVGAKAVNIDGTNSVTDLHSIMRNTLFHSDAFQKIELTNL